MEPPNTTLNSSTNMIGLRVTSSRSSGVRRMCSRLRRTITHVSRSDHVAVMPAPPRRPPEADVVDAHVGAVELADDAGQDAVVRSDCHAHAARLDIDARRPLAQCL